MADERREHDLSDDCWCWPSTIPVRRDDGTVGWVYAHHPAGLDASGAVERWIRIAEAIHIVRNKTDEEG